MPAVRAQPTQIAPKAGKAKGLNVGLSTHWYSGIPENAYGFSASYFSAQHYLVPRGSVGNGPLSEGEFMVDGGFGRSRVDGRVATNCD